MGVTLLYHVNVIVELFDCEKAPLSHWQLASNSVQSNFWA